LSGVAKGYEAIAAAEPNRVRVVNGSGPVESGLRKHLEKSSIRFYRTSEGGKRACRIFSSEYC